MDKKPLIGVSICAVVLLVLGSLSNVVGYTSVKSTVNDSPLFQTRTQRATNQQQTIITFDYVGNEKNTLIIPPQASQIENIQKIIDKIRQMDDNTFHLFTELCVKKIKQEKSFQNINPNDIVKTLVLIKKQSSSYPLLQQIKIQNEWDTINLYTVCFWFPGCLLYLILVSPLVIFLLILMTFTDFPNTWGPCTTWAHCRNIGYTLPAYC